MKQNFKAILEFISIAPCKPNTSRRLTMIPPPPKKKCTIYILFISCVRFSSRPAAKTTTNQTQAAKPNGRKEHVCTTSKPLPGAGVKQRPPLKSRISFSQANKTAKPLGAASSIKSSASSKVATTPASGNLVKTEKKNSNLEADKLYTQIKQNLEVKKNAARLQSMGFKGNFKQTESSNHFVLLGDVTKPLPKTSKIVRLFTSSTFTGKA